jgi:hypothetical protein
MGFFDSLFTSSGNSDGSIPTPDLSNLNKNVFFPSNFMGHPRIGRALDNALLAMATTQSGDTLGDNIGNVARSVIGADGNRASINLNRQMAPYLAMEPLVKMQGEIAQQNYMAKEGNRADAQADYYEAGGRQMRPEPYVDGTGKAWTLTPKGPVPMLDPNGNQLTGHQPGGAGSELMQLIHGEEAEDFVRTGVPWSAAKRSERWAQLAGTRAGMQTQGRIENTPGYLSDTTKEQLKTDLSPIDTELDRLNKLSGVDRITENAVNPKNTVEQRIQDLTNKRNQILNHYIPQGYGGGSRAGNPSSFPVDIPQPISPVATDQPGIPGNGGGMRPGDIGGIPIGIGPGVSDAQLNAAIVPPGPKPAKPAPVSSKPSPSKPKIARPRITIDSKGNVSVN